MPENPTEELLLEYARTRCNYGHLIALLRREWVKLLMDGGAPLHVAVGGAMVDPYPAEVREMLAPINAPPLDG
jgi:hypothetical protein